MIPVEVVKIVAENTELIEKEIEHIYAEWQAIKLKNLGYTWGFGRRSKDTTIRPVYNRKWNLKFITVNSGQGCEFIFPTRWISDENWKIEAMLGITNEVNLVLIEKLSE
jgi:hypothetical protein